MFDDLLTCCCDAI